MASEITQRLLENKETGLSSRLGSRARPPPGGLPLDNARSTGPGGIAAQSLLGTAEVDGELSQEDGRARPAPGWRPAGQNYNNGGQPYNRPNANNQNSPYNPNQNGQNYNKPNQNANPYGNNGQNQPYVQPSNQNYNQPNNSQSQPYNQPSNQNYNKPTKKPYSTAKPRPKTTTVRDVNECYLGTDNCHPNANCINLKYGFKCTCKNGFQGDGVNCNPINIDECANGQHNCDNNAQCINLVDGYDCRCNNDYTGDGYKCSPNQVDECALGLDNCSPYAECIDKNWGFKCKCNKGYEGDGVTCTSTDPCDSAGCSPQANCNNGQCSCKPGYSGSGIGAFGCYDLNECTQSKFTFS